jgi:hypothetical protein
MRLGLLVDFRRKDTRLLMDFKEELIKLLDLLHLKQTGSVVVCCLHADGYSEVYSSGKRPPLTDEYLAAIAPARFYTEEAEITPIVLKNAARTCVKHMTTSCSCLVVVTDCLERWQEDRSPALVFPGQVQYFAVSTAACEGRARQVHPDAVGLRGMFRDILQLYLPEVYGAVLALGGEGDTLEIEVSLTPACQYLEKMKGSRDIFELFVEKKVMRTSVDLQLVFGRPWFLSSSSPVFAELYRTAVSEGVSLVCSSTWDSEKLDCSFLPHYYVLITGAEGLPCFLVKVALRQQLLVSEFLRPPPPLQELPRDCRLLPQLKDFPTELFDPVTIESGIHHRLRAQAPPQMLEPARPQVPPTSQVTSRRTNRQLLSGVVAGIVKRPVCK